MAEWHDRCRYYPHCLIHLGESRPRDMAPWAVREIRAQHEAGETIADIAREWRVVRGTISTIVRRRTYRNVAEERLHRHTGS